MSRRSQILLAGFFLIVISSVALTQAGIEIARSQWPQAFEIFKRTPSQQNLRAFERDLERASVHSQAVRPWVQLLWFATLRKPGEKTLLGRDGWLFYKPDVRYLVEPAREFRNRDGDPVSAILDFRDQLAQQGIRLLLVPMPGKPSIYFDELTRRARGVNGDFAARTRVLMHRLQSEGVETADLFESFLQWRRRSATPFYLLQDTHWSGRAARYSAELVAQRIRSLGWAPEGAVHYETRTVRVRRVGDLVRMMELPRLERNFPPEEVLCDQVLRQPGRDLYKDDPRSPVLVLGDSFLRMYETDPPGSAGFIAHLARELKMPLASIVNDGGASTLVRQELSRKPDLLAGKKLVIWEFVERDLRFGTEGWKRVPVPLQAAAFHTGGLRRALIDSLP